MVAGRGMKRKKQKNPLRRRLLRELKSDITKYLAVFFIMILTIGLCSGYQVSGNSMVKSYYEGFEKYNIEDGHFRVRKPLNRQQAREIEALGVRLCELFYVPRSLTNGTHIRIYANRYDMDKLCLMKGAWPEADGEIALDRMFANNNDILIGDTVTTEKGETYTVTAFVAFPDYSCLFENNSDTMFDSVNFGVAAVTPASFSAFPAEETQRVYAWAYDEKPQTDAEKKNAGDDLFDALKNVLHIEDYLPAYLNQAIVFTIDDIADDNTMMTVLCYMLIAIIAFIFAVTSKNTILREATVIGTLRASGYSRGEIVRHYLSLPVAVSLVSSLVGNILGYTVFKDFCASMYYGSYSLFTYRTVLTPAAFVQTTLIPLLLMLAINFGVLYRNVKKPVLGFLRGDLSTRKNRRAVRLPTRLPVLSRFRLRVVLSNASSVAIILLGALFSNLLLMFGMALPQILDNYEAKLPGSMIAEYQYMLTMPLSEDYANRFTETVGMLSFAGEVTTENETAEPFSAFSLQSCDPKRVVEDVTLYGVRKGSRYVSIRHDTEGVYISSAFAEKYDLAADDAFSLYDPYEETYYEFTVSGVYPYDAAVAVFMDQEALNRTFGLGSGAFVGYFADTPITDIDETYIGAVIDKDALSKVSRQLKNTMGDLMYAVDGFAVVIFLIVVYLLLKLIIEKSAHAISVTRILGFRGKEIGKIYLLSLSASVAVSFLLSILIDYHFLKVLYKVMIGQMMKGWLPLDIGADIFIKMILLGLGAYAAVALIEYRKIRRIPMDLALKTVD